MKYLNSHILIYPESQYWLNYNFIKWKINDQFEVLISDEKDYVRFMLTWG
jgi:hypothetical protein